MKGAATLGVRDTHPDIDVTQGNCTAPVVPVRFWKARRRPFRVLTLEESKK